jgi:hypothetical protein
MNHLRELEPVKTSGPFYNKGTLTFQIRWHFQE